MAQPVNTFDSYDAVGIREDLSDVIHNISPEDTPLYTKCAKGKAKNTYHEWQTDSLRASQENAHPEGDDTAPDIRASTVRLGNYTQIFKNGVSIPGTDEGLDKAGRAAEMAYQVMKIGKEQKLDIERALFANQARNSGATNGGRRFLAGVPAWLNTNTNFQSGGGGADPSGDGTNARTDDSTPTAFSQTKLDNVLQQIWLQGGKPNTVYLSSFQMGRALTFVGNNNQRSNVDAGTGKVVNTVIAYQTPWGTIDFMLSRENRARDVLVLQDDMWAVGTLRGTRNEALGKTGDSEKRQVITELTLVCKNEKASGGVFDNTVA